MWTRGRWSSHSRDSGRSGKARQRAGGLETEQSPDVDNSAAEDEGRVHLKMSARRRRLPLASGVAHAALPWPFIPVTRMATTGHWWCVALQRLSGCAVAEWLPLQPHAGQVGVRRRCRSDRPLHRQRTGRQSKAERPTRQRPSSARRGHVQLRLRR